MGSKNVVVDCDGVPIWKKIMTDDGAKARQSFYANDRDHNYESLARVLNVAYDQASVGKGRTRHAKGEPFEDQLIMQIARLTADHPEAFQVGQAVKKAVEAGRLSKEAAAREYAGAINYLAAASLRAEERK